MNNSKVLELAVVLSLFLPTGVSAESVILKSGKKIEGKIVEQNDRYIKVESDGSPIYYERKYIESIIKDDTPGSDEANSFLKSGLKYGSQGKFQEAGEEFKKGLKVNQSDHNLREVSKVIDDLSKGSIKEGYAVRLFKGSYHLISAEYEPAVAEFKEALKINPDDPDIYYYLGVCNYSLERYDEAITCLKKVAELKPNDEVYYYLGASYYSSGQYPKAIDFMEKALKTNPDDAEAYSVIGTSRYLLGQLEQAKEAFVRAIGLFKGKGDYLKAADIEEFLGKLN